MNMKQIIWVLPLLFVSSLASATIGPLFTYEGVLTDTSDVAITTTQTVTFQIILNTSCIVYEETQTVNPGSDGEFSVIVGTGSRNDTTGNTIDRIFASAGSVGCNGSTSIPAGGFLPRELHVKVGSTDLSPNIVINNVPVALNAQRLNDRASTEFILKSDVNGGASCPAGDSLTWNGTTQVFECSSTIGTSGVTAGTYGTASLIPVITVGSDGRVTSVTSVAPAATGASGAASGDLSGNYPAPKVAKLNGVALSTTTMSSGQVLRFNGTAWVNGAIADTDVAGLATIAGLVPFSKMVTCTADKVPVWISVTSGFQCQSIAISPSQVGIGGTFSGNLVGAATANVLKAGDTMTGALGFSAAGALIFNDSASRSAALKAPSSFSTNYSLVLPPGPGSSGQVLSTDGAGVLSWTSLATANVAPWVVNGANIYDANGGNVGVGTSTPSFPLTVSANSTGNIPIIGIQNSNSAGTSGIGFLNNTGSPSAQGFIGYSNSSTSVVFTSSAHPVLFNTLSSIMPYAFLGGNVGIGTTNPIKTLQVAGEIAPTADDTYTLGDASLRFVSVFATNGTIQTSDAREKKEITNSDLGLEFVNKLRPVSYRWKTGPDKDVHYGLIAQETEKIVNESRAKAGDQVKTGDQTIISHDEKTDKYGLKYTELISPLIKAVQDIYHTVVGVEAHQSDQDRDIASIKAENVAMKSYLCAKDPAAPFCH